jgi:iron complex outermembrane receptor protein
MEADNVFRQKSVSRLNASVSWVAPSERWFVKLWGSNLTNEAVVAYSSTLGDGTRDVTYEAPRTYGLSAGYRIE